MGLVDFLGDRLKETTGLFIASIPFLSAIDTFAWNLPSEKILLHRLLIAGGAYLGLGRIALDYRDFIKDRLKFEEEKDRRLAADLIVGLGFGILGFGAGYYAVGADIEWYVPATMAIISTITAGANLEIANYFKRSKKAIATGMLGLSLLTTGAILEANDKFVSRQTENIESRLEFHPSYEGYGFNYNGYLDLE
ncbi:MAG: hypothetical protein ABH817_00855 [archaeon]